MRAVRLSGTNLIPIVMSFCWSEGWNLFNRIFSAFFLKRLSATYASVEALFHEGFVIDMKFPVCRWARSSNLVSFDKPTVGSTSLHSNIGTLGRHTCERNCSTKAEIEWCVAVILCKQRFTTIIRQIYLHWPSPQEFSFRLPPDRHEISDPQWTTTTQNFP